MPVRYKRRRSFRSRKRLYKRRRRKFKSSVAKIAKNSVFAALAGKRQYRSNARTLAFANDHGEYSWCAVKASGTKTEMKEIFESTDHQDTGSNLAGTIANEHRDYRIIDYKKTIHLRNLSTHPIFLSCYEVTPTSHVVLKTGGASTLDDEVLNALRDGWHADLDATAQAYISAVSSCQMKTEDKMLRVSDSRNFSSRYKVLKYKKFKLNPGDDVFWTMKFRPFTYYTHFYNQTTGTGTEIPIEGIKNFSKVLLFKMEGALGHDTSNTGIVGPMSCDVAVEHMTWARTYPINRLDHATAVRRTEDTIVNLEGPTEHSMAEDEP